MEKIESNLKITTKSDWIIFLEHKRRGLDEITNNIWASYYFERTISLTVIVILLTTILTLVSISIQLDIFSEGGKIILYFVSFLGGIGIVIIVTHFWLRKQAMNAISKLVPFRYPLDEMLMELMYGKYKNITQLQREYEKRLKPLQEILNEMGKPFMKKENTR